MTVEELKTAVLELSEDDLQTFLTSVLEGMPVVRMNALVKHLEDTWDVSAAAAPAMMMSPAAGVAGEGAASAEAEEQTEFDVILKEIGSSKLAVIKVVREVSGLGIKEAKALVDNTPKEIKEKVSKSEAEEIHQKLTEAGAVAEIK